MLDADQLFWTEIAAGVCLLIFAGFAYGLLRLRSQIEASKGWRKIEGEIIASEVEQPPSHFSDDLNDAKPVVRYRYRAGVQNLESDRIKFGGQPLTTRVLAGALAAKYPIGARVDVHIDPNDPKNVALEPREQDNIIGQLVLTIVFGVIAGVLTAHALAGKVLYAGNGVPLFAFALPAVALLVAAFAFAAYFRGRRLATASARWPTTTGKITNSSVIEERINTANSEDKTIVRTTYRYWVDLRYAYQVGGRDFVGAARDWAWTSVHGLRQAAEKEAARYSPGQSVTLHYDPARPGSAVLEPGNRQGSLAPLVFGAISSLVGAAILAFFLEVGFSS